MDFNVRKLAADAGIFFSRAVQFTEEKLGQAERTELDAHFENLLSRADCTKNWTEKIYRQTEVLLQPNPGARIEEFLYEKLERKVPPRATNGEILGQYMLEAGKEFGADTPYGSTLIQVADSQRRLGGAQREFLQTSSISFLTPLRNFLEGDWRTISKERKLLENMRLDLDACKARLKKAKAAETKAALWHEELTKVNHLRCLREFVEGQAIYYNQCHQYMQELQKELGRACNSSSVVDSDPANPSAVLPLNPPSPLETDALQIEEVQPPASGTRNAKVLYNYTAADSSELSLRADEVSG
ncbi:Endophilin-B2 SH3 domain-containing GRB2-like protein B2 [Triplophysa tibetana]|uniref:Endophilin-B2 SH3 domain-containing GRB2-like protein B2 n=1 Tax=Triplophysa tibetana TaxID=1572043 RepID=A0A5A9NZY8_9TELE|nr:Endophilin-B2 SH3 domain-containing GRB2-like protein B2 [Triplophysa tibetana]